MIYGILIASIFVISFLVAYTIESSIPKKIKIPVLFIQIGMIVITDLMTIITR